MTELRFNYQDYINNLITIKKDIAPAKLCIVCKCNSYGLGLEDLLKRGYTKYVDYLAITENQEAKLIRKYDQEVSIIRIRPAYVNEIAEAFRSGYNIEEMVESMEKMNLMLCQFPEIKIHLSIDTGMSNMGISLSELMINGIVDYTIISELEQLNIKGIMTHCPDIYNLNDKKVSDFLKFSRVLKSQNNRRDNLLIHIANSANYLNESNQVYLDMVRIGICQYGMTRDCLIKKNLLPTVSWTTYPVLIRQVNKGDTISYSRTYVADRDMKITVVPVGYHHGYVYFMDHDSLFVMINNVKCQVVGKITMNVIAIDTTEVEHSLDDKVILLGKQLLVDDLRPDSFYCEHLILMNIFKNNKINFV